MREGCVEEPTPAFDGPLPQAEAAKQSIDAASPQPVLNAQASVGTHKKGMLGDGRASSFLSGGVCSEVSGPREALPTLAKGPPCLEFFKVYGWS